MYLVLIGISVFPPLVYTGTLRTSPYLDTQWPSESHNSPVVSDAIVIWKPCEDNLILASTGHKRHAIMTLIWKYKNGKIGFASDSQLVNTYICWMYISQSNAFKVSSHVIKNQRCIWYTTWSVELVELSNDHSYIFCKFML